VAGPVTTSHPDLDLDQAVAVAADIASAVAAPLAAQVDAQARWPEEALRALQAAGLGGLTVPRVAGGQGHGLLAIARVCETLARACPSTALCFGMHCVGAAVIAAKATADQRERYLEPIARGEHLTTLALSEPGTGAQFYLPQTQAARDGEGFVLTGAKSFLTNGGRADSYVVSGVAADADGPPGRFSCWVLPAATPGLRWGAPWDGLGMRGNSSRSLELSDVRLGGHELLGAEGDELWYVFQVIAPYLLIATAGTYLGVAAGALEHARAHLAQRAYTLGSTLGQQPVLQHRLGRLWAQVQRTRALVLHAARSGDAGEPDALPAILSAKAEVGDCATDVTNEAMTLCGGIAYRTDADLSRALRDARAAHVMAPTTDILRTWAGRALLGLPLLAD
jgi:alkylation response protein AidB-like acyl-CoA dehydrogenase